MELSNERISDFLTALASKDPTPGGGGASYDGNQASGR